MHTYATSAAGRRVLVVVMDTGDEAIDCLSDAVGRHRITAGQVTAVGGFSTAAVGFFDPRRRDYERIPVPEQTEVLSLLGDIAEQDGEPALHLHAVLGRRDGSTVGGHLLHGEVSPTLEVIVTEVPAELAKHRDPQTGLALIRLPQ